MIHHKTITRAEIRDCEGAAALKSLVALRSAELLAEAGADHHAPIHRDVNIETGEIKLGLKWPEEV